MGATGGVGVVLAGGAGTRMGADRNKVLLEVGGVAVVVRSLLALNACPSIGHLVLVARDEDRDAIERAMDGHLLPKLRSVVPGGVTRTGSEQAGVAEVRRMHDAGVITDETVVFVHDAARPFVDHELIDRLDAGAATHDASIPGIPFTDPVVEAGDGAWQVCAADRFRRVQTPQAARCSVLLAAYAQAAVDGYEGLDTADVIARYVADATIVVVDGDADNIKLTTPDDLPMAAAIVQKRSGHGASRPDIPLDG